MKEKCPRCDEMKDDVAQRPNAYARDVGNEEGATMTCCDECAKQNALDI